VTESTTLTSAQIASMRKGRRHPRLTQFDYLHVRRLVDDIVDALARLPSPVRDVLDVYCGTRPYDDLLPRGARCVGLDVMGNPYGELADVISNDFLPFEDESFDLVTCYEAFQYVPNPEHGVAEMGRVLRPGGTALVTVPFAWEYDRSIVEHRYTESELRALFADWEDVDVVENGGRVVVWATLTGTIFARARTRIPDLLGLGSLLRALFTVPLLLLNAASTVLSKLEERGARGSVTMPMNLLVTARKPAPD
jgi:SAM-dependent methyltransferase